MTWLSAVWRSVLSAGRGRVSIKVFIKDCMKTRTQKQPIPTTRRPEHPGSGLQLQYRCWGGKVHQPEQEATPTTQTNTEKHKKRPAHVSLPVITKIWLNKQKKYLLEVGLCVLIVVSVSHCCHSASHVRNWKISTRGLTIVRIHNSSTALSSDRCGRRVYVGNNGEGRHC